MNPPKTLLKPLSRTEPLHAKILALLVFNLVIILVNIIVSYAIGLAVFGLGEAAVLWVELTLF